MIIDTSDPKALEALTPEQREALKADFTALIQEGLDSLDRGEGVPLKEGIIQICRELGLDVPDLSAFE